MLLITRKANRISDATAMVMTLIEELKKAGTGDAALFKKLFVLIGLLYQESRSKESGKAANKTALDDLLSSDQVIPSELDKQIVEDPWKGRHQDMPWGVAFHSD